MKSNLPTTLSVLAALSLTAGALRAAGYSQGKITRLEKDVKILKENAAPHAATIGENVAAVTSVATGASSRAELMFPDKSLTRLGANSRFTVRGEKHTIDLDKGVMLIEVPEKLRDAKVRTAAVTAAVTGGTMIFEFLPGGFVKIMVIEGIVDLFLTSNPSQFATLHAGQMIIQPVNAATLNPAVDFDLKLLLMTSKLLYGDEEPNSRQINDALSAQQALINDGDLVKTNLVIPGLGTVVQLNNDARFNVFNNLGARDGTPGAPQGGGGGAGGNPVKKGGASGPVPPSFQGVVPLITGLTVLNAHSFIKTDPQVTAFNVATGTSPTSEGSVYNAATDGPFPYFGFGSLQIGDPGLQARLESQGEWAAYKFEKLLINGTPRFDLPTFYCGEDGGDLVGFSAVVDYTIPNVILSALGDITLAADNQFSTGPGSDGETTSDSLKLKKTGLEALLLYSQNGNITLAEDFEIKGGSQEVTLVAAGATSNVTIGGDIKIYSGTLLIGAGQDLTVNRNITADEITLRGGRDVTINGTGGGEGGGSTVEARRGNLLVSAKRNLKVTNFAQLKVTNSAQLKALSELAPDALLRLESLQGEITVDGSSYIHGPNVEIEAFRGINVAGNSWIEATHTLKMGVLSPTGTLSITDSTLKAGQLINLYAQAAGTIQFDGIVHLDSPDVQISAGTVFVKPTGNVYLDRNKADITASQHKYNIGTETAVGVGKIHGTTINRH